MKTNLRERLTRYRCFIRPKVQFTPIYEKKKLDLVKVVHTNLWGTNNSFIQVWNNLRTTNFHLC